LHTHAEALVLPVDIPVVFSDVQREQSACDDFPSPKRYVFTGHSVQDIRPLSLAKNPGLQSWHTPGVLPNMPSEQDEHVAAPPFPSVVSPSLQG